MPPNFDFTGYVPIDGSSENGYLSINSETVFGGVSIMDISFDPLQQLWSVSNGQAVDFSPVSATSRNCSGTITSWGSVISCEEAVINIDLNEDGYDDIGWNVEIDPATRTIIDKRWAMGNFAHENVCIHENDRTVYQGADSTPGYIYKFVADAAQDLSSGRLYVYKGEKEGSGEWLLLANSTPEECNTTLEQCAALEATVFSGVEDLEIGPDGWVYAAVKNEDIVYRFLDSDPIDGTSVTTMETFVGNASYLIEHENGSEIVEWGTGVDNLAFDDQGNLWVLQDGSEDYIWVVESGHTQADPKVKIFAKSVFGSEPTGITFSPDYRFLFMSFQHPSNANGATGQLDAARDSVFFNKDIAIVIARKEHLGLPLDCSDNELIIEQFCDSSNGTLNVTSVILGSTPPYQVSGDYEIANLQEPNFSYVRLLQEGIIELTVQDAEGCVVSQTAEAQACDKVAIELSSFTVESDAGFNQIKWTTASEFEIDHFQLMRSNDGIHFESIAEVSAEGFSNSSSHYQHRDVAQAWHRLYYQLEAVDFYGNHSLSQIITIEAQEQLAQELVIQHTLEADQVFITVPGSSQEQKEFDLFDLQGKLLAVLPSEKVGEQSYLVDTKDLARGMYLIRTSSPKGRISGKLLR